MSGYSMFNSADDCLAPNIGEFVFDESLLLNVLLQEKSLLHEAYFFNSTLLAKHIGRATSGAASLFELASQRGLIIPAFRDSGTISLEQAYDQMTDIYGRDYVLLNPQMQPFRDRVVAAVDKGLETTKPFYWPSGGESSGEGYQQVIAELLQTDNPPEYSHHDADREQLIERVWVTSKRWRFDNVEEAIRHTRQKGGTGLQRTELFCSLGWSVGLPRTTVTMTPGDIVDACTDAEQKLGMEIFLKWVTQCHHLNQARQFGTAINFPVYSLDRDFILDSILRSELDAAPLEAEGFRCEVPFPPLEALLSADATELVAIRSDLGLGYLLALRRWQNAPNIDNEEAVKVSLRQYCDRICKRYDTGIRQTLVAHMTPRAGSPWEEAVTTGGKVGEIVSSLPLGLFSQFTHTAMTIYTYVRRSKRNARLAPKKRRLEVTLPTTG